MMKNITCPKCNTVFQVDDSTYNDIVSHIKEEEIKKAVNEERQLLTSQYDLAKQKELNELKQKIIELNSKIENSELETKLRLENEKNKYNDLLNSKSEEIINLKAELKSKNNEFNLEKNNLISKYNDEIKQKEEEIALYKDKKTKLNVKLIGEDLEQHCLNTFNAVRMQGFQNATFEKDNEVIGGSKGDFIYKEYSKEGAEIISIMFEMKNEAEGSENKHKNEDFFEKLDKDRKK